MKFIFFSPHTFTSYQRIPPRMSKKQTSRVSNRNTELINLNDYDLSRVFFDNVVENELQQGNKTIKYYKVQLGSRNQSGIGEFVFEIPFFAHSFGVEEFQNEQGKATNYSVSLSLVDSNNPQEEQTQLVEKFGELIEKIKDHVLSIKKEIKKPTLDRTELKKFNPMYQSLDEDGNPKGDAWYFAPKLMTRKNYNREDGKENPNANDFDMKIETKFYVDGQFDAKGEPIEISPLEFVGKKHFKFMGSVKIDTIYIGSKISLQCKVYDGVVQTVENKRKRLVRIGAQPSQSAQQDSDLLLVGDEEEDE